MKNYLKILRLFVICTLYYNCVGDIHEPSSKDSTIPGKITSPTVTNIEGGAIIKYIIPEDEDLLYVEAKYKLKRGDEFKVRSSVYSDTLRLEGFGDTDKYIIDVYSVDRSENRSEAVKVEVQPLIPPVKSVAETVQLQATFGGINVSWENITKAKLALILLSTDSINGVDGISSVKETFYSEASLGNQSVRGYDTREYKFSVVVRDRWENYSDTIHNVFNPLLEEELDKSKFKEVILYGDTKQSPPWNPDSPSRISRLWDGVHNTENSRLSGNNGDMPDNYYYTFDLGVEVKLSRFKFWQFTQENGRYLYFDAQYKKFEVWGTMNLDETGSWGSWTKLRDCEIIKPSGNPLGIGDYTNEDKEIALRGHDFEFSIDDPIVRYIRIKVNSTFSGLNWAGCGEITFWGTIQ